MQPARPFDPETVCKMMDESLVTKRGIIFNIMNNQAHGTAQYVKGLRIDLDDPRYLCKYIERNYTILKAAAAALVHEFFLKHRVNLGIAGPITVHEYSASFTMSSLSPYGKSVLSNGEEEGPMWFCAFPKLLAKTPLADLPDGTEDSAYIVNLRIHQVNHNLRIRPPGETQKRRAADYTVVQDHTINRKPYNSLAPKTGASAYPPPIKIPKPFNARSRADDQATAIAARALEASQAANKAASEVKRDLAGLYDSRVVYPTMPKSNNPGVIDNWPPPGGVPKFPDNL
jgi:hypothetical protein